MTRTFQQVKKQIEELQREASVLRDKEMSGVIDRIKLAIREYALTPEQLGFRASTSAASAGPARPSGYSDGQGRVWSGRGPRPAWLKAAIASGRSLDEFRRAAPASAGSAATAPRAAQPAAKAKPRRMAKLAYLEPATGRRWGGMGPRPAWLRELIGAGRALEEFAVPHTPD